MYATNEHSFSLTLLLHRKNKKKIIKVYTNMHTITQSLFN